MDTNDTITADSLSDIWPSHVNEINTNMLNVYKQQSRVKGHQSSCTNLFAVARPANAPTPRTLNISEPKIPPSPTSESATNEEIMLVKNSGAIVAKAANEAAATSWAKKMVSCGYLFLNFMLFITSSFGTFLPKYLWYVQIITNTFNGR